MSCLTICQKLLQCLKSYAGFAPNKVLSSDSSGELVWTTPTGGSSSDTSNNGITKTGSNFQLGGTLIQNTDINQSGFDLSLSGNGDVSIGTNTFGNKLTVKGDDNSNQYAVLQLINQTPTTAGNPYFGFYTIVQTNKIGMAIYNSGTGQNTGLYLENMPTTTTGSANRTEMRAGGSVSLAGAETVIPTANVPNVPVGQDIAHYGNGYAQRIWAFATALDTNYNKYLGNQNWNTIYWLNQSAKTVPFHRFDNQAPFTHSMVQYVNANGAGASGSMVQYDNGSGNSSNTILINHNSTGRPVSIVHNTGTARSGFESNGKFSINYGAPINMSAQSYLNVGGSMQISQKVVGVDYTVTDLDYHISVLSASPVTITLPNPSNTYRRIYVIKNIGTGTVTLQSPGFLVDGNPTLVMNITNQTRTLQASYNNVANTNVQWSVIGGYL